MIRTLSTHAGTTPLTYGFLPGRVIVLLDGIVKKQDKIPPADVQRVLGYRDEVERRGPHAP